MREKPYQFYVTNELGYPATAFELAISYLEAKYNLLDMINRMRYQYKMRSIQNFVVQATLFICFFKTDNTADWLIK